MATSTLGIICRHHQLQRLHRTGCDRHRLQSIPGINAQTGAELEVLLNWAPNTGVVVGVGPGAVNNNQAVITGEQILMGKITGTGSLSVGDGTHTTLLQITPGTGTLRQSA